MKNKYLAINSFTLQATLPLYSTAYLVGLLKSYNKDVSQLDVNCILWNEILSTEYIQGIEYNDSIIPSLNCPLSPTLAKNEFEHLKNEVLEKLHYANKVIRSKDIYDFNSFCLAQKIYYDAFVLIYHQYGTFLTTHFPYWADNIGFNHGNIEEINKISQDSEKNPLISILENKVLPIIERINPEIVFVEIMFPYDIIGAQTLNNLIKKNFPHIHINYPGISFDEFNFSRVKVSLKKDTKFMCMFDSIFIYRNDQGIIDFINERQSEKNYSSIKNLAYINNKNVVINDIDEYLPYNEEIIPDYSDLDLSKYFVPENVFIDRLSTKCFWSKCSFCSINSHKGYKRLHKVDIVVNRIKELQQKYNVNYYWFLDEACPIKHALKFARELKNNNVNIIWSLRTRIDESLNYESLQTLYDSGLRELWIGLEHVNEDLITKMNKTKDPKKYKECASSILNNAADIGIGIHFCHLLGFPSETPQKRQELLDFYIENKEALTKVPFFGTFNTYGLAVDSPVYNAPEDYGLTSIEIPEDRFIITNVPYTTKWNDQTNDIEIQSSIDSFSSKLMKVFTSNVELEYFWYVISDSPYELLFKANYKGNPFLKETK